MVNEFTIKLDGKNVTLLDEKGVILDIYCKNSVYDEKMSNAFKELLQSFIFRCFLPVESKGGEN